MTTLRAPTGIRLSQEEHRRLSALAARNERSLAAEIRIAIRNHLAWNFSAPAWNLGVDALPLSEDTGCPPGCPMQAVLTEGQGNAAETGGE